MYNYLRVCLSVCKSVSLHDCLSARLSICTYVCTVCTYVCTYGCTYVCTYVCTYLCTSISHYIYTLFSPFLFILFSGALRGIIEVERALEMLTLGAYYKYSSTAFVTFNSRITESIAHVRKYIPYFFFMLLYIHRIYFYYHDWYDLKCDLYYHDYFDYCARYGYYCIIVIFVVMIIYSNYQSLLI